MVKDGVWRMGSLNYCMKTDCTHHGTAFCDKECFGTREYNKKSCGNCKHPDGGVCHHAGEVSSNYVCETNDQVW